MNTAEDQSDEISDRDTMGGAEPSLQQTLDRLACAEIGLYDCQQHWKAAHEEVGRALRREREAKGLSLRKVAIELECSAPFLSDCELGRRRLSPEKILKYRTVLQYA